MPIVEGNQVFEKDESSKHHKAQGSPLGLRGTLHGLLVSGLQFVRSLLEDEGGE